MDRRVIYMAHPVSGDVHLNLARAMRWLAWLRRTFPEDTFIAPWIAAVLSGEDDSDPVARAAGLADCLAVVVRCDTIMLVGGRISTGMQLEMEALLEAKNGVFWDSSVVEDFTHMGVEPPTPKEPAWARDVPMPDRPGKP